MPQQNPSAYTGHRPPPRSRMMTAFKYGLIFGGILFIISLLGSFSYNLFHPLSKPLFLLPLGYRFYIRITTFTLLYWLIYFFAGFFVARRTQQIGIVSITCLWASLCYFVGYCLSIGSIYLSPDIRVLFFAFVGTYISELILHIGLGIGIGMLGGLIGKNLAGGQASLTLPTNQHSIDGIQEETHMYMDGLTSEAQQVITREELGSLREIYMPPTVMNILAGVFALASSGFIIWLYFMIFENSSLSSNSASMVSTFYILLVIMLLGVGGWMIFRAIYNRNKRAIICTHGVVLTQPEGTDSFRWQDVLTAIRSTRGNGKNLQHLYTVHCHDGRKIVFKDLSRIHDLAESIDVQIARAKQSK